jgi:hypothetical protein
MDVLRRGEAFARPDEQSAEVRVRDGDREGRPGGGDSARTCASMPKRDSSQKIGKSSTSASAASPGRQTTVMILGIERAQRRTDGLAFASGRSRSTATTNSPIRRQARVRSSDAAIAA